MKSKTTATLAIAVFAVGAAMLFSGCASSERMLRLSGSAGENSAPRADRVAGRAFGRNAGTAAASDAKEVVNLWPFFFRGGAYWSALWPLIDRDSYGCAFRPFYNREGNEYAVLFPLSAWNPVNGDGWCGNVYWNRKVFGAVPLFHTGPDLNYAMLYWRFKSTGSRGVFPIARFSGDLSFLLPFWWWRADEKDGKPGDGIESWGVFPAARFDSRGLNYVANVWLNRRYNGSCRSFGVFPVFYFHNRGDHYLFPLYGVWDHGRSFASPLVGWARSYSSFTFSVLGPVWLRHTENHPEFNSMLSSKLTVCGVLGFHYSRQSSDWKSNCGDFAGVFDSAASRAANPLAVRAALRCAGMDALEPPASGASNEGEFWKKAQAACRVDAVKEVFGLLPLFFKSSSPRENMLWVFPFFFGNRPDGGRSFGILGSFGFLWEKTVVRDRRLGLNSVNSNWLSLPLLAGGSRRETFTGETARRLYAAAAVRKKGKTPLESRAEINAEFIKKMRLAVPDISLPSDCGGELDRALLVKRAASRLNLPRRVETSFICLPLIWYGNSSDGKKFSLVVPPLLSGWHRTGEQMGLTVLFPLWHSSDSPNLTNWRLLGWLARGKISATNGGERDFRILEYLYRRRRSGNRVETLLFPFISIRAEGETSLRWSFLWRVLEYRREAGKITGHVLFIPVGRQ